MMDLDTIAPAAFTSSASASTTTIQSTIIAGLARYDWIEIDAKIVGCTGGTLDVYLQRRLADDVWVDWAHFTQVAAATTKYYHLCPNPAPSTFTEVGWGTNASTTGSLVLAAGTCVGGHPGDALRVVTVTGSGVSVAGTATFYFKLMKQL